MTGLKKKGFKMRNYFNNFNFDKLIDIALIAGIVVLASNDKEGWGWLVFILAIRN